jgi:hypothetical protein
MFVSAGKSGDGSTIEPSLSSSRVEVRLFHRYLSNIDCFIAHSACLVCFISTAKSRIKKERKKKPRKPDTSSGHITNLKQSIFCLLISMDFSLIKKQNVLKNGNICWTTYITFNSDIRAQCYETFCISNLLIFVIKLECLSLVSNSSLA